VGKRSIFRGIGRELVQRHGERLDGVHGEPHRRAGHDDAAGAGEGGELVPDQRGEVGAAPVVACQELVRPRQCLHAAGYGFGEGLGIVGAGEVHDRLDDGQHVLRPMIHLAGEERLALLARLALADILKRHDHMARAPIPGIGHRGHVQLEPDGVTVLVPEPELPGERGARGDGGAALHLDGRQILGVDQVDQRRVPTSSARRSP
jgi:hypothetical protein